MTISDTLFDAREKIKERLGRRRDEKCPAFDEATMAELYALLDAMAAMSNKLDGYPPLWRTDP